MTSIANLQPPHKTVLSQEIYNSLRAAILDGAVEPGTRIVEEALARQMQVSRAPLREALWRLERDGLLKEESPRDTRVISLSHEDIKELHLIRTVLETLAFQHTARLITAEQLASLDELVNRMGEAASSGDSRSIAQLDYEFHKTLCQASGLPRVYNIWYQQHILFRLWLNVIAGGHGADAAQIVASHRAILDAIRSKDNKEIARQVKDHVYRVGAALAEERERWAEEEGQFYII